MTVRPIYRLDPVLRRENERLRRIITDMLAAPYQGQPSIALAITTACVTMEHPGVKSSGACSCGKVP